MSRPRRRLLALVAALLLLAGGAWAWRWAHRPRETILADGSRVYAWGALEARPAAGFPQNRELALNGEALLEIPQGTVPFRLRTRLMVVTASGPAELKVTAYASDAGEEVQVLRGTVQARKAYPSASGAPETLSAGDMVMVNRSIDLMEKERDETARTRAWADRTLRRAGS